ncbi:Jasmonoyl--L-amino acid synthetase JAR4 [Camellia lanceoleosa]|uniref:Jasmonoyl--L-amino acid synthetase JAR4 n=1 Tax=Camellia lanceoleosa TaxID=1840588 RepID=A0ACC0IB10_9ERIC|nr:Jasmonoyl--L-amino acid synthetase JAR4 [Camellia lanceoleosa]
MRSSSLLLQVCIGIGSEMWLRSNLLLTINIDKNTEKDLQLSVEAAGKLFSNEKLEVVDFTSHVDLSTDPGHYVICWEVSGEAGDDLLRECCNCLDRSFVDAGYVGSRKVKTIGRWNSKFLRGTFEDSRALCRAWSCCRPI